MKAMRRAVVLAGLGCGLLAGPAAAGFADLAGTAGYDERTALPPRAVLEVQLLELAQEEGAEPLPIATVLVRVLGSQPYPFRLTYDEEMVRRDGDYALAARIVLDGETVFRSAEAVPVFTGLGAGPAEIRMVRPAPEFPVQPGLAHTSWVVTGMAAGELSPQGQAEVAFGEENAASGTGGCNAFEGSYRLEPPHGLSFGEIAATLRGCSPGIAQQERLVFRALGETRRYAIDDAGALVLYDENGEMLLRLRRQR